MLITFMILGWLLCATLSAGIELVYFQNKFKILAIRDYKKDLTESWISGMLFGPLSLVASVFCSDFCKHGFMNPFVLDKYNKKD